MLVRSIRIDERFSGFGCRCSEHSEPASGPLGGLQAHSCQRCHQTAPRHPRVGQRRQGVQLRGVLLQSAVAHLDVAELALDHPERVLHLRSNAGFDALQLVDESSSDSTISGATRTPDLHTSPQQTIGVARFIYVPARSTHYTRGKVRDCR